MNKYKVEITQTDTYVVDVKAENEEEAKKKATEKWDELCKLGTYHHHQNRDTETKIDYVYDVTNTDDPFMDEL